VNSSEAVGHFDGLRRAVDPRDREVVETNRLSSVDRIVLLTLLAHHAARTSGTMLVTIVVIFSIFFLSSLWVIGFTTMGSLIRTMMIIAFVAVVIRLIQNRPTRNEYR
jgi:hypothetical protein